MEFLQAYLSGILTASGFFSLVNVILIDIVMSGDNAIVIGLATRNLQGAERKKAIAAGVVLATLMRVGFALAAVRLLQIVGLKFAGGLLLLYVVWKFYKELRAGRHEDGTAPGRAASGLAGAIWLIVLADVSMSLDNVLAVAGAARENLLVLGIGLFFSILLMAVASGYIARKMDQFPQIQWLGLLIILFVAIEMLLSGSHELDEKLFHVNILPFASIVLGIIGFHLHSRYVKPASEAKIAVWCSKNWRGIFIAGILLFLCLFFFGHIVHDYFTAHPAFQYFAMALALFIIIEITATMRGGRDR